MVEALTQCKAPRPISRERTLVLGFHSTHWIIIFIENFIQHTTFSSKKAIYRRVGVHCCYRNKRKYWEGREKKCGLLILFALKTRHAAGISSNKRTKRGLK